jgi:hypothetical protein
MVLESKFNVGDEVYAIDRHNGYFRYDKPPLISGKISKVVYIEDCFRYRLLNYDAHWNVPEDWMFSTREELADAFKKLEDDRILEIKDAFSKGTKHILEDNYAVQKKEKG